MVRTALDAATAAAAEGRSVEVIDLRTLSPLDLDTLDGLRAAHPAAGRRPRGPDVPRASARRSPPGSPNAASTTSRPRCCGSAGSTRRTRPSRLEEDYLPDLDRVLDAVDRALAF